MQKLLKNLQANNISYKVERGDISTSDTIHINDLSKEWYIQYDALYNTQSLNYFDGDIAIQGTLFGILTGDLGLIEMIKHAIQLDIQNPEDAKKWLLSLPEIDSTFKF